MTTLLTAVNALGANQQELAEGHQQLRSDVAALKDDVAGVKSTLADTNARVRSLEEGQDEIKDLLIRALGRPGSWGPAGAATLLPGQPVGRAPWLSPKR